MELQALAVRTNKIYIQELPVLSRHPVELFLDIEGKPDQHRYYLFGLLVCENGASSYYPFWGDTAQDEEQIWRQFLAKVDEYPEASIYHYGTYEPRAIEKLGARYQTDCDHLKQRMVNVLAFIYGKVYFPTLSNSLKEIPPVNNAQEGGTPMPEETNKGGDLPQKADRLLLANFTPASVVIDADMEILHVRGHTSPNLELAPGKAGLNLLNMVRDGLGLALRTAVHAVSCNSGAPIDWGTGESFEQARTLGPAHRLPRRKNDAMASSDLCD